MYEIAENKPFYWSLKILNLTYGVPNTLEQPYLRRFLIRHVLIKLGCLLFFTVLTFYHVVSSLKDHIPIDISEDLSVSLGGNGAILGCTLFTFQYAKWSSFFINLENCSRYGTHPGWDALKETMNFLSRIFSLYTTIGIFIYATVASLDTSYCEKLNEEYNIHEICGTFVPLKLPFETKGSYVWLIITFIQVLLAISCVPPGAMVCFMAYEATELVISHIQHLKHLFEQVFDVTSPEERRARLRFCVKYHVYILRLSQQLNNLVKNTVGHMSLICALVFGCLGNQVFNSHPIGALIYLLGYMVALFLLCHSGQRLLDETLSIGDAVYFSKWYEGDVAIMKDVAFIIARCQIPVFFEALPLGSYNYQLYVMIIKTSYTYLTLLQQST